MTKHQAPNTKLQGSSNPEAATGGQLRESGISWSLEFEASLELGAWSLELPHGIQ